VVEYSEYGSWADVDAWAQRLFALPQPTPAPVAALVDSFRTKGLQGEALVAEVLRFVQDEVRYFSVSLGESSHRPKAPQQTLAELLGDCKDKVVLLNTLLRDLGFEVRPALVSMQRNRGIREQLPSPEAFDHVITKLELDGRSWYLDPTINGQGLTLATRGHFPYGAALVVGAGADLQAVPEPPVAASRMEFEQQWDLSEPGRPVKMTAVMRVHGFVAERWRSALASAGKEPVAKAYSSGFARLLPGIKTVGELEVSDDRQNNRLQFSQAYELAEFGRYDRGALQAEYWAPELLDVLSGPAETQRRTPFMVDQPRLVESRIVVKAPVPLRAPAPPAVELVDRQFRFSSRVETADRRATFVRRYERREDQVLPAELPAWRDKIVQARQNSGGWLRLPLVDGQSLVPEMQALEKQLRSARGWRADTLQEIVLRNEFARLIDSRVLERVGSETPLAWRVLNSRAAALNTIGRFDESLRDSDKVLAARADDSDALQARAVSLVGLGRLEEALATFARVTPQARPADVASWMGQLQLQLGRPAQAEPLLREAVAGGSGEGREFALIWLYFAAERQGGRGKAAIALAGVEPDKFTGALLRYLTGELDREGLLRQARVKPEMERLNLAEAHFYIGQRLLTQGQRDEALRAFQRTLDTQAVPYREYSYAQVELKSGGR
jgi:tetratricopeptide (TPR) repeat protein